VAADSSMLLASNKVVRQGVSALCRPESGRQADASSVAAGVSAACRSAAYNVGVA